MTSVLLPWQPTSADRFDLRKAGHLLRRAGYGGSLSERRDLVRGGVEAAVAKVFSDGATATDQGEQWLDAAFAFAEIARVREFRIWLALSGRRPLQQRMSAFWHGHFATSNKKVQDPRAMLRQFATFDRLGLAAFLELAQAMVRDPALLRWLDNDSNGKDHPNENFAREWFELFTLGEGNYQEPDVREAAAAFTGYHVANGEFVMVGREHDRREKTILGQRGAFTGDDVVRISIAEPCSARFLATKWLRFFVHPEPEAAWIEELQQCYVQGGRNIGTTVRTLLCSQLFFSPQAYRSKVKSPAELLLGAVRACGASVAPKLLGAELVNLGEAWGEPPTVEGFHGERAWLSPATWLLRSNTLGQLFLGQLGAFSPSPADLLARTEKPAARVQQAIDLLLDGEASPQSRARLLLFANNPLVRGPDGAAALLHATANLPEFHLL